VCTFFFLRPKANVFRVEGSGDSGRHDEGGTKRPREGRTREANGKGRRTKGSAAQGTGKQTSPPLSTVCATARPLSFSLCPSDSAKGQPQCPTGTSTHPRHPQRAGRAHRGTIEEEGSAYCESLARAPLPLAAAAAAVPNAGRGFSAEASWSRQPPPKAKARRRRPHGAHTHHNGGSFLIVLLLLLLAPGFHPAPRVRP
jgi:hypothetical protein